MPLPLEIALGLAGYCLVMWLALPLYLAWSHRRYRRSHGEDYYGGSGELGLVALAPVLPLLLPLLALLRLFDR